LNQGGSSSTTLEASLTASLAATAATTSGRGALGVADPATSSSLPVVILFAVLALLCAVSVGLYVRSQLESPFFEAAAAQQAPGASPQAGAPPFKMSPALSDGHHHAADDSALGLATPSAEAGVSRRAMFRRRNTVIVAEVKQWTIDKAVGTMSEFSFVVNMFADLGPPGLLPLVAGLKNTGYVPAFIILVVFYGVCVYTMFAVAKTMDITGARDYASQWSKCVSPSTSWVPVFTIVCVTFGTIISYSCFFADIFQGVMPAFGLPMSRSACLLAFTLFPTLPLCLVKDLSALSFTSIFALVATVYMVGVMVLRCLDGSYAEGGSYYSDLEPAFAPNVPSTHLWEIGLPSLTLVNALALGFLTHYNACKYYRELKDHTPAKLATYTRIGMGLIVLLFAVVMVAGFQTFGTNANSVILKNYSRKDTAINAARLGMGFSIVASFPLMFSGLREACIILLKQMNPAAEEEWDSIWRQDLLSMCLLALITAVALVVTDAGMVVGVVGSICGISVIYIVPSILYAGAIQKYHTDRDQGTVIWLRGLTFVGATLAIAGCVSTLVYG